MRIRPEWIRILASRREGVALLLAILLLAVLLTISLGIFEVVFGEIRITEELSDSFVALYAADQGIEQLLRQDLVDDTVPNCSGNSPCTYGPAIFDLGGQRSVQLSLRRTGSGDTQAEAIGEYRFGSERSVKRRLVASYQKAPAAGFSPDTGGSLESGLVAYWPLNESSGTRSDVKGSNHLTDNNTVTSNPGRVGNAAQFVRAASEYLSIADNPDVSTGDIAFTVAAWAYLDSKTADGCMVSKGNSSAPREYVLCYDQGNDVFYFEAFDGAGASIGRVNSGAPSVGQWYFVVAWHDPAANTVNIQQSNGTVASRATTGAPTDTASVFRVGAWATGGVPGFFFDGRIDEVGIWKRVLSAQERTDLYNNNNGNTCASPCQ